MRKWTVWKDRSDITNMKKVFEIPTNLSQKAHGDYITEIYKVYYKMLFWTRHKVWFKTVKTKKIMRIILVTSPNPLNECDKVFLKRKGFKLNAPGCTVDSCLRCHPTSTWRLAPV
jgi:hypothetical protein